MADLSRPPVEFAVPPRHLREMLVAKAGLSDQEIYELL